MPPASDENVKLAPPDELSLERAIEFIEDDELVEVTPKAIRLRKRLSMKPTGCARESANSHRPETTSVQRLVKPTVSPGALSLDAPGTRSPDVFAIERERIFAHAWVYAGREEQLENPGDYFLAEVAGEDLILLRDGSSVVRAFYNVCRHRGARLCEAAQGHVGGSLQCPYHAWTYALDGALLAARNMQQVEGFDRARYPLIPARVALAGGFIFVSLAGVDEEPNPRWERSTTSWSAGTSPRCWKPSESITRLRPTGN